MSGSVEFHDHTIEVQGEMDRRILAVLEECAGEMESAVKRNTAVDTGQLKSSWQHKIEGNAAYIGSPLQNAIWEEFGTGEYALNGDGRKGGWVYINKDGEKVFTRGKRPKRAFWRAYNALKNPILKRIQQALKGM